jgi:uncharacterized protein YtpQ (UPF0354 family)
MKGRSVPGESKYSSDEPTGPSTMERLLDRVCQRDEFFLLYSKLLQEKMPTHSIEFIEDSVLRIGSPKGKTATIYLENLWLLYRNGSEDRAELIEKYARMAFSLCEPSPSVTRDSIVAMIKDAEYMATLQPDPKNVSEHLCGDLWIVFAVDLPETIVTLSREAMESAGATKEELRALAVENLTRILPEVEQLGDGPWYTLTAGTNYVASLLLFDSIWDQLAESVEGQIVASVPTRDVLLFTGSQSADGIAAIRQRSEEISKSGHHAISDSLVLRENGKWTPFYAN